MERVEPYTFDYSPEFEKMVRWLHRTGIPLTAFSPMILHLAIRKPAPPEPEKP